MRYLSPFCVILALGVTPPALAQHAPPIPGVTGTMATAATVRDEGKLANTVIVATEDGVKHMFPAGKGPLSDLTPGTTVAVYTKAMVTEGTVPDVKVGSNEIRLRYTDGTTEQLVLTEKEAEEPGQALKKGAEGTTRIIVYTANDGRGRIARYFKPKS